MAEKIDASDQAVAVERNDQVEGDQEIKQDDGNGQDEAFGGISPALASKMQEYSQKLQNQRKNLKAPEQYIKKSQL